MTCNVIATGSKGNAVQLGGSLLLDCGVPFKALSSCYRKLKLVLLTHLHSDHFNRTTVRKLAKERPALRFGCCEWMVGVLVALGVRPSRIDIYETGKWYEYGPIKVSPLALIHDVPNCGYRLEINGKKALYATDTGSMSGIDAVAYDLYMIEANHTEVEIQKRIERKLQAGEFFYEYRAAVGHLSKEKADAFLKENAGENSRIIYLHAHEREDSRFKEADLIAKQDY